MSNLYLVTHTAEGKKMIFECKSLQEEEAYATFNSLILNSDQELFYSDEELSFREVIAWQTTGKEPRK